MTQYWANKNFCVQFSVRYQRASLNCEWVICHIFSNLLHYNMVHPDVRDLYTENACTSVHCVMGNFGTYYYKICCDQNLMTHGGSIGFRLLKGTGSRDRLQTIWQQRTDLGPKQERGTFSLGDIGYSLNEIIKVTVWPTSIGKDVFDRCPISFYLSIR